MHSVALWLAEPAGREPCGIRRHDARRRCSRSAPPERNRCSCRAAAAQRFRSGSINLSVLLRLPPSFPQQRVCTRRPEIAQALLSKIGAAACRLLVPFWSFSCAARLEPQLTLVLSDLMLIYFCSPSPPGVSAPPKNRRLILYSGALSTLWVHSTGQLLRCIYFWASFRKKNIKIGPAVMYELSLKSSNSHIDSLISKWLSFPCHNWLDNYIYWNSWNLKLWHSR